MALLLVMSHAAVSMDSEVQQLPSQRSASLGTHAFVNWLSFAEWLPVMPYCPL